MKKILSLIVATVMCVCCSVVAGAETQEKVFPMTATTGTISFKGISGVNCNIVPDVVADDYIVLRETGEMPGLTSVKLVIEGDRGRSYVSNVEYEFVNYLDADCFHRAEKKGDGVYWCLNVGKGSAYMGDFLADSYTNIYSIAIAVTGELNTTDEKVYCDWGTNGSIEGRTFDIVKDFYYDGYVTDSIAASALMLNKFDYVTKTVRYDYPFIGNTDENGDSIITRNEVYCLSFSALGAGEGVFGFEGLASQTAEFFNKKDNGKIIFHVTTAPATYSNVWTKGGVPSSQIGMLNGIGKLDCLIGLFFNYDRTGSLVSTATVDENGNIEFDITNILNDVGSNSLATIHSVYYGLVGGYTYTDEFVKGLKIDKVTLSYTEEDEEMVDECEIAEEVEEEVVEEETETEDEPEEIEEEPEEDIIIEDEAEIVPDVEIEPIEEPEVEVEIIAETTDEDKNPGTGAALVVIPAVIAAGAVIISRKRK